jgi:hypothetical protein
VILCVKKSIRKKFKKTDIRFEFLDSDYPSVKPYKKFFFSKKSDPLCKKIDSKKNLKKLTSDSSSLTLMTLRSTLIKNKYFYLYQIFGSISEVRTHNQASKEASKQTIYVYWTLLYEKEN